MHNILNKNQSVYRIRLASCQEQASVAIAFVSRCQGEVKSCLARFFYASVWKRESGYLPPPRGPGCFETIPLFKNQ